MKLKLENISAQTFAPFGTVLEFPADTDENFHILVREENSPWQLALSRVTQQSVTRIANHPDTMESFEPLEGQAVILVAEHESPEKLHAFFLDKPVCLYKGIWHATLALSAEAKIKITENINVSSRQYDLEKPIAIFAGD